jgi:signal transduction histidine kinase
LEFVKNLNKEKFLYEKTFNYTKVYKIIYEQHQELANIIFSGILNNTNLDKKLDNIQEKSKEEKDHLRKLVFIETLGRFKTLKQKHVSNIEFMLKNGTMFLDMKNPLNNDYKISENRILFKKLKDTNLPQSTFEIRDNCSGLKFAFPIIEENKFLGAIIITFNEQAISSLLMNQYDVIANIILREELFDKEFLKGSKLYKNAHKKGFLHNTLILKEIKHKFSKNVDVLKPEDKITNILYSIGGKEIPKSYYIEDKKTIATIIPLINSITNENQGFISILTKGSTIGLFNDNYEAFSTLFILFYLALVLLFYQQKVTNILDKEKLREMMQKDKQILEQAKLAQMGEMLGNIAHQWRQPLSAISTVASGLKINYEYNILDTKDIPKQMDLIVENTKHLSKTIDIFRDFIKEGKALKNINIQEKLDECINIVSATISSHHIKLINEINYEEPITLRMISGELSQVIINIINNSKDAIVQNKIKKGWIKIIQKTEEEQLLIIIEDNGGGISSDIMAKIFDPYFTTKHQYQGTGLGLYMSKTIIEKHLGGKLEVKNGKEGAIFTIRLKLSASAIKS